MKMNKIQIYIQQNFSILQNLVYETVLIVLKFLLILISKRDILMKLSVGFYRLLILRIYIYPSISARQ